MKVNNKIKKVLLRNTKYPNAFSVCGDSGQYCASK